MKQTKKPHELDAAMDILDVMGVCDDSHSPAEIQTVKGTTFGELFRMEKITQKLYREPCTSVVAD